MGWISREQSVSEIAYPVKQLATEWAGFKRSATRFNSRKFLGFPRAAPRSWQEKAWIRVNHRRHDRVQAIIENLDKEYHHHEKIPNDWSHSVGRGERATRIRRRRLLRPARRPYRSPARRAGGMDRRSVERARR